MSTKVQLGILSNLYLNANTYSSPAFSPVTLVGDCTVSAEWEEGEASTRESRAKQQAKTMVALSIAGKLKASLIDNNYAAMLAALASDTVLNVMALNGALTQNGVRGWMFDCQVYKGNEDQSPGTVVFTEFELKPYPSGNPPQQVLVVAGAPVFVQV